ncbi:EAL domain-containing protein [Ectothiorhodospira magna]|nr:EAL domain-containing protein [Ectothiorhodospira magna]
MGSPSPTHDCPPRRRWLDRGTVLWLGLILVLGSLVAGWKATMVDQHMRAELLAEAERLADTLNLPQIGVLSGTRDDLDQPEYQRLKQQLMAVRQAFPRYRFIYLLVQHPDHTVIVQVDSEPIGSEDQSPPGEVYAEISAEVMQVFDPGIALTTQPTEDRWGVWISALLPLPMPDTRPGQLALGIDVDADHWRWDILRQSVIPVGIATLLLMALVVAGRLLRVGRGDLDPHNTGALRHTEPILTLCIGLVLSLTAAWIVHGQTAREQSTSFQLVADASAQSLIRELCNLRDFGMDTLVRFFESSRHVSIEEFDHFTQRLTESGLAQNWAWAPRVHAQDRERFEEHIQRLDQRAFYIWDTAGDGQPSLLESDRQFLYPILRQTAFRPDPDRLGFDLNALERVRQPLEIAYQTGLITALPQLRGTYAPAVRGQMLIIQHTRVKLDDDRPEGAVFSTVDFNHLIHTWDGGGLLEMEFWLLHPDGLHSVLAASNHANPLERTGYMLERPILGFGEAFLLRVRPGPDFPGARHHLASLGTGLAGTVLTVMLSIVVGLVIRRRETLEHAVLERTLALQEFRSAVEQSDDGIALTELSGKIRFINQAWARMHGYEPGELNGAGLDTFHTPEQMATGVGPRLEELRARGAIAGEAFHRHRTGRCFPVHISTSLIRDPQGRPIAMLTIARDISEEVERRQREQFDLRFRALVADTASRLVTAGNDDQLDAAVSEALRSLGMLFEVDRAYLFRFSDQLSRMRNTHEWCADGITSYLNTLQSISTAQLGWWSARMQERRPLQIPKVNDLPEAASSEKTIFQQQDIQSLICLPILDPCGTLIGFIGLDSVTRTRVWSPDQVAMLQAIADLIAAALARHDAAQALADSEARYRELARESRSFRWEVNLDGFYTSVDAMVTEVTGYLPEELIGKKTFYDLTPADARETMKQEGLEHIRQGLKHSGYHNRILRRDGSEIWVSTTTLPLYDPHGGLIGASGADTDITARKAVELQLKHMAHHDPLTGLPNRVLLADRLQQAMLQADRRGELLGVACVDLDAFKPINDRFGHEVGDRLLVTIAQRMGQVLREGDTVARLGGDEFALVLVGFDQVETCRPLLERLLDAVSAPLEEQGQQLGVSVSIGVTFYPQSEDIDADQLLRQADQAMYQAKLAGKNRYHLFDAAHDRRLRDNHQQIERIRQGLDSGEFVLYYQPKVDMKRGGLIGVEALIRWQHPKRGLLPPGAFLPLLENHTAMLDLGTWVMTTAMQQITDWRAIGLHIPISLNVDPLQLAQPDFIGQLRDLLARYPAVQPGDLDLEVLETSALDDTVPMVDIIRQGDELGVSFSLDDFGTGYSSLSYLKKLPVATLKIDRSFVRDMLFEPDDLAILQGVINLARTFRQAVVAEGVETETHGKMLLLLGCELGQGYAIARPMPADQLETWLTHWSPPPSWQNTQAARSDQLPFLTAMVEYRSWANQLQSLIRSPDDGPLSLTEPAQDFTAWLSQRFSDRSLAEQVLQLHGDLNQIAQELIELASSGSAQSALDKLPELEARLETLLELLRRAIGIEVV